MKQSEREKKKIYSQLLYVYSKLNLTQGSARLSSYNII